MLGGSYWKRPRRGEGGHKGSLRWSHRGPVGVGCSVANKTGGAVTAYLGEEEQRQRIRELVRKKTGMDWPTLRVGEIQKSMSSATVVYWCTEEDVGKRGRQKQLELTDEEARLLA
jgi:hypothetical protein